MTMRRLIVLAALLASGPAMAIPVGTPGPMIDFDSGLAGMAMVAGAAFLAWRRRSAK
jgi:MYXO-CTERM domain-containing protein